MIWLPIEPHEARSFKFDRKLLVFFMNASSEMRHPAEKEGKKPKRLSFGKRKLSVIARGISVGDELEYADEITLGRSIVNRTLFTGTV